MRHYYMKVGLGISELKEKQKSAKLRCWFTQQKWASSIARKIREQIKEFQKLLHIKNTFINLAVVRRSKPWEQEPGPTTKAHEAGEERQSEWNTQKIVRSSGEKPGIGH